MATDIALVETARRDDIYEWQAHYKDGTYLDEYGADGSHSGWKHIDLENLDTFLLIPKREGLSIHALKIVGDARPIFFRRRQTTTNVNTDEFVSSNTITVIGMQWTVRGVNVQTLTAFYADGSIFVTDDQALIQ